MAETVYSLCALTSVLCMILLMRGYRSSHSKLLFWASFCFAGLALNNLLLLLDLVMFPQLDLALVRTALALIAMMILLFGLVWESR